MQYEALLLDGSRTSKMVACSVDYTEQQLEEKKGKMKFEINGVLYAGWCRRCGCRVREDQSTYIENVDGLGNLMVDVFCKYCL